MAVSCVINEETVGYLKTRLYHLEENKKQVIESLLSTSQQINKLKEKYTTSTLSKAESITAAINDVEHDLTVSSYPVEIVREKEKHIDKLKRELLKMKEQNLIEEELIQLRNKRKQLKQRLDELRTEFTEIDAAICISWVIIFSRRHNRLITPDEVHSEMIPMSSKQYSVFRKRPIISRLEEHHCCKCTYTRCLSSCVIYGEANVLSSILDIFRDCLSWGVYVLPFNPLEVSILLYKNCMYLHEIENTSSTLFYINHAKKHVTVQGGELARKKAKELYQAFFQNANDITLSDAGFLRLANKSKPYFQQLKSQSNCFFFLDFKKHILRIYGNAFELGQTKPLVESFLQSLEETEKKIDLAETNQISFLIGEKGLKIREMTARTNCHCTLSAKNESPFIILRGCALEIEEGEHWLDTQLVEYNSKNQRLTLPELGIPLLLNNRGKELRRIEQETFTQLLILKDTNSVIIRGKEASHVAMAKEALSQLFASITSQLYTIPVEVKSEMIGRKGDHINSLRKKFHCSIQLTECQLKCEGSRENVRHCNDYLHRWLEEHSVKHLYQSKDLIGKLVIGKEGIVVKQLEEKYHIRIAQQDQYVSLIGPSSGVEDCFQFLQDRIDSYLRSHFSCTFTPSQWSWCPRLSRASLAEIQKQHSKTTVVVVASTGMIRCEGSPAEIESLKEIFESIQNEVKGKEVHSLTLPKEHVGLVIGKNGATIKELEKQFQADIKFQQETLFVWCSETQWNTINQTIKQLIEEKALITQTIEVTPSQRVHLFADKCRAILSIQSSYSVQVKLPALHEHTLVLQGNRGNCTKAAEVIQSILAGTFVYHYHYKSDCCEALLKCPSFHIERIALATHCNIQYDSRGNIDIRGNFEGIHKAHSQIYSQLMILFPTQFQQIELTAGVAYYLTNGKSSLGMESPTCTVRVEPAEKMVYIFGHPKEVEIKKQETYLSLAILQSENVLLPVDKEIISYILGSKGRIIKELEMRTHAEFTALKNSNEVYIHGRKEEVDAGYLELQNRISEYQDLNCHLTTTSSLLQSFLSEYGNLLRGWEEENACTVRIDQKANSIHIHGSNKEDVENMKFVVENMLETVEMNEEKCELNSESDESLESSEVKQQIDMLLGLV